MRTHLTVCFVLILALLACTTSKSGVRPEFGPSRVVVLKNVPAVEAATALCHQLSGAAGPGGGCALTTHCSGGVHRSADGRLTVTVDPQTNALILAASPGCEDALERALAALREIDLPKTGG